MRWSVPRDWEGETAVVVGGGPSLKGVDLCPIAIGPYRTIAINTACSLARWADYFYFADNVWHNAYCPAHLRNDDRWVTGDEASFGDHPTIKTLRLTGQMGFDPDPRCLRSGNNSGYAAIHLAAHFGVKRILLLGFDMRVVGGKSHWHDETRPTPPAMAHAIKYSFLPMFERRPQAFRDGKLVDVGPSLVEALAERQVEVVNCCPDSALTCWPRCTLEEALSQEGVADRDSRASAAVPVVRHEGLPPSIRE